MRYIFYVPEENEPIEDVYYPDERDAPMPVEPLVHCKECRYLVAYGTGCAYWDFCDIEDTNGFCAWGERREV